jgi:hypothetical protein
MGRTCNTKEMRNVYKIWIAKPEGKIPLRSLRYRREDIIRGMGGKVWAGCIWLMIGTIGRLL